MGLFRNVNISFWTDTKIVDEYTPEDRYFMLYAMTNQYTNIIGCYEISLKQMSNDLGYTKDVVERIIKRFKEIHNTIDYNNETKELLIKNWYKYNWNLSPKLDKPLFSNIENVKCDEFHDYLANIYNTRETTEEKIPYRYHIEKKGYPIDTTITITNTISNTNSNTIIKEENKEESLNKSYEEIIGRLNELTGSSFRASGKATKDLIKSLLKDYSKEDILMVIDKMCYKWGNDEKMKDYLRPSTLFCKSKFDNYYGMKVEKNKVTTKDLHYDFSNF